MSILESIWEGLLEAFSEGLEKAIEELRNKNIENIPGAKDALLDTLDVLKTQFPRNDGELLKRAIDSAIQNSFFPNTSDFAEAFSKILRSRTHEQDFIINELINGFVSSRTKAIASYNQGPIIDRMVEAFAKRNDFHIVDHQFYAMFGDPNKPRSYIKKNLQELINLFGLVSEEFEIDKDLRRSEKKVYTFYTFPPDILKILKEKYIIIEKEKGIFVKALLEMLQNSTNAKATEIKIEINAKSMRFIDNGKKTKKNNDTEKNGDYQDEQFKEKKLQMFNFGKIIWKTKNWIRDIDIKNNIDTLKKSSRQIEGTDITIVFYEDDDDRLKKEYEKSYGEGKEEEDKKIKEEYLLREAISNIKISNMKIYINSDLYEEVEKEIELDLSIYKRKKNKNLVYAHVSEAFDRNVFICLFLANIAVNRNDLEKIGGSFTINGISAIFALIFLLSFMPKINVQKDHPILNNPSFNKQTMSIIPKSWMMKQVLEPLFEPLIKIIAYRLGGGRWLKQIIVTEINKKIHNQIRFLLKDVNKWILGNLCLVEIPIFVEIANIFIEVTLSLDRDEDT